MNTFIIPIGDWSDDGHGKCDRYYVDTNLSIKELGKLYIEADKKLKISDISEEWEDNTVTIEQLKRLEDGGIINWEWLGFTNEEEYREELKRAITEGRNFYIEDTRNLAELVVQAINLEQPNTVWMTKEAEPLELNNWSAGPNLSLPGYGMFS